MQLSELIIAELQHEAVATRKMLARVPPESLAWRPHEKSMTLGRLAAHVASLPGLLIAALKQDELDTNDFKAQSPATDSVPAMLERFDQGVAGALELLKAQPDERWLTAWRYRDGARVIFEMPRLAVVRFIVLNHLIHHRGQLSVYLRLLNAPLPPVYGPTADESAL